MIIDVVENKQSRWHAVQSGVFPMRSPLARREQVFREEHDITRPVNL